ncbi:DEAD/DEAH box helicase [Tropicibacter sp. Alg240-R139]|uniref:DEAD/DEAH box helicase n=1 Tax=Tropicibacter sp. Alg240-R139 TaxID=2305991 RepID=UPI0013DECFA0|nr:DEAD/DEAH box helicase [Tropicibacter sp. Alg240-R139]
MKQVLADALKERGYETLTQVQEAVTQPELNDRDLLVSAQTGSGKTVGFGLALGPTLLGEDEAFQQANAPLALIIAPTRELALQVKRELTWLYNGAGAFLASCVGGMDMRDERRALSRGSHIVVATPGRLRDHIMRGSIDLSQVRGVVLDEADEMLDLGFAEDLEFILGECPEDRRTLMFSATVPRGIAKLAENYQNNAERVTTVAETSQHSDIEYRMMSVAPQDAENAIINVLRYYEAPNAIIFANTRAMVARLTARLSNRGFPVVALSGELTQSERTNALQSMRDGRARVCVATDVAARGIDLPGLDLVVHAELPNNHETLLHRSGRTGRAGRKGVSALIVPPKARSKAQRILRFAKLTAEMCNAPSADEVKLRDEERMLADSAWQEAVSENEQAPVQKLMDQFSPEQIAAAYLRLYHERHSAPEELNAADAGKQQKPRAAFGPSVWFSISGGHDAGAEPRTYLPMICKAGDLTKDDIGAIRVQQSETFVELKQEAVAGFLANLDGKTELEPGAVLKQLASAPDIANSPRPSFKGKPRPDRSDRGERRAPRDRDGQSERPAWKDKGHKDEGRKPRTGKSDKPARSTPPIDWNDASEPRRKKPKAGTPGKSGDAPYKKRSTDDRSGPGIVAEPAKKRAGSKPGSKPYAGKAADKPRGGKPKGPPPPAGKPDSKKNKARAMDSSKRYNPNKGGDAKPRKPRKG